MFPVKHTFLLSAIVRNARRRRMPGVLSGDLSGVVPQHGTKTEASAKTGDFPYQLLTIDCQPRSLYYYFSQRLYTSNLMLHIYGVYLKVLGEREINRKERREHKELQSTVLFPSL
jgi:hypothetical protein